MTDLDQEWERLYARVRQAQNRPAPTYRQWALRVERAWRRLSRLERAMYGRV